MSIYKMNLHTSNISTENQSPTIRFTPAPGSPWRQIPDEVPITALPYPFDATRVAPEVPSTSALTLTKFTATNPNRLSKAFALKCGKLDKQPGGNLIDGRADRVETDLCGLAELLTTLGPQHALSHGITPVSYTHLTLPTKRIV